MIASAIAADRSAQPAGRRLVVGVTGYSCGVLFALHGAPDLALTQFLVETLTLVIFVLVLRKLPAEAETRHATGFKPLRALLGLAFGALLVLVGLFAAGARNTIPMASRTALRRVQVRQRIEHRQRAAGRHPRLGHTRRDLRAARRRDRCRIDGLPAPPVRLSAQCRRRHPQESAATPNTTAASCSASARHGCAAATSATRGIGRWCSRRPPD